MSDFTPPGPTDGLTCHTDPAPEKVTAYLTPQMHAGLEALRSGLLVSHGLKATKTTLVQAALHFMLKDYELNGTASWIYLRIAHLNRQKGAPCESSTPSPAGAGPTTPSS